MYAKALGRRSAACSAQGARRAGNRAKDRVQGRRPARGPSYRGRGSAGEGARRAHPQGSAFGRADPVRIRGGVASLPRRTHCETSTRLCNGQRRNRPLQCACQCRVGSSVLLLPRDPDASAEVLRTALAQRLGVGIGIVISDSFGRAWRKGVVNIALGAAGVPALLDLRGKVDRGGRPLQVTEVVIGDALAATSQLLGTSSRRHA